jgi:hypothetical protein
MAQTTLTLRVVTDGDAASTSAGPSEAVNVFVKGILSGDANGGLALWSSNMTNTGSVSVDLCDRTNVMLLDAPAGNMQYFARNLGLTNPGPGGSTDVTGYSGTCDGAMGLWQIGGGLNTINNTGPTLYPIGTPIPLGVADAVEVVLAEGTITTPASFNSGDIVLTLGSEFANVILAGEVGPVYAVEEASTALNGALTITAGVVTPPVVTDAWSFGYHAGSVNADLGLPLNVGGSAVEPRQINAQASPLYLEVTFGENMAAGAQSVTTNPAIAGVTATGDGSATILVTFPANTPLDDTCYQIDLAGSTAVAGGVEAAGDDFCVCYNEGDIDRSGTVAGLDNSALGLAFGQAANNTAATTAADLDRNGTVAGLDNSALGLNFGDSPSACP